MNNTDKLLRDIEARLNKSKSVWYMTSDNKPFIPNNIWHKDAAQMNKLIEIVKVLRDGLITIQRQCDEHIKQYGHKRDEWGRQVNANEHNARTTLTKSDEIAGE